MQTVTLRIRGQLEAESAMAERRVNSRGEAGRVDTARQGAVSPNLVHIPALWIR